MFSWMLNKTEEIEWKNECIILQSIETGTVIHIPRLSVHGYNNNSDGVVKMTMIFNPGLGREYFFRKMYQLLDETPNDSLAFQKLYLENDSYSLNEKNMIPMK